jgi:voltage-gated potassium channel
MAATPVPPSPPPAVLRRPGLLRFSAVELLISLVVLFVSSAFLEYLRYGDLYEGLLMTVVMILAVLAVGGNRRTLLVATLLVMPALLGKWSNHLWPKVVPSEFYLSAYLVFLVFVVSRLLHFILRAPRVNGEVLCAGISGYLMLGLVWVVAYLLVSRMVPDAFTFSAGAPAQQAMTGFTAFYFSFATLTTIGYGDISPVANVARMLSVMEAVTGMFYITLVISRLVALYSSKSPASEPGGKQDSR